MASQVVPASATSLQSGWPGLEWGVGQGDSGCTAAVKPWGSDWLGQEQALADLTLDILVGSAGQQESLVGAPACTIWADMNCKQWHSPAPLIPDNSHKP